MISLFSDPFIQWIFSVVCLYEIIKNRHLASENSEYVSHMPLLRVQFCNLFYEMLFLLMNHVGLIL